MHNTSTIKDQYADLYSLHVLLKTFNYNNIDEKDLQQLIQLMKSKIVEYESALNKQ